MMSTKSEQHKSLDNSAQLPPDCEPLEHQVAGHFHGKSKTNLGLLQTKDGCILKAVQSPPRGMRELNFYKRLFTSNDKEELNEDEIELRKLIPIYFDTVIYDNVAYIKMEDVAYGIKKPSVMDLKMGRITYDPEATAEKVERQKLKYPPAENTGFQIMGMRIYDAKTGEFTRYDKHFGRSRREEDLIHCLGFFYQFHQKPQIFALKETLNNLNDIKKWFQKQKTFHFYASSLLLFYESDLETIYENGNNNNNLECKKCVRTKLADLTHIFPANGKTDDNFLFGLDCLIEHLNRLLNSEYSYQDPTVNSL